MRVNVPRSALAAALWCLALAACANLPPTTRRATPDEQHAIVVVRAAFDHARGTVACPELDRVDVAPLPVDELRARCISTTADACVSVVQRSAFERPSTLIRVRDDLDPGTHARLVQHEAAHILRGCWVFAAAGTPDYLARLRTGATEQCPISYPGDHAHCDAGLWITILADARRRLEGSGP